MIDHPSFCGNRRILAVSGTTLVELWPETGSSEIHYRCTESTDGSTWSGVDSLERVVLSLFSLDDYESLASDLGYGVDQAV